MTRLRALFGSGTSIEIGSPRPSAGEGLGMRGIPCNQVNPHKPAPDAGCERSSGSTGELGHESTYIQK